MDEKERRKRLTQWVREYRAGFVDNIELIFEDCNGIVKHLTYKKYYSLIRYHGLYEDDFKQDLYLALCTAIQNFNEEHEDFSAYAYTCLNYAAIKFFREHTNRVSKTDIEKGFVKTVSTDEMLYEDGSTIGELLEDDRAAKQFDYMIEDLDKKYNRNNISKMITEMIPDVNINLLFDFYGFYKPYTMNELCEKYGITKQKLIGYERMIIFLITNHENVKYYFEKYLYHLKLLYTKHNPTHSIGSVSVSNVLKHDIESEISGTGYVEYHTRRTNRLLKYGTKWGSYKYQTLR